MCVFIIIDGGRRIERPESIHHVSGHEVDVGLGARLKTGFLRLSVSTTQMSGISIGVEQLIRTIYLHCFLVGTPLCPSYICQATFVCKCPETLPVLTILLPLCIIMDKANGVLLYMDHPTWG